MTRVKRAARVLVAVAAATAVFAPAAPAAITTPRLWEGAALGTGPYYTDQFEANATGTPRPIAAVGGNPVSASTPVTGLTSGTTYHFRVVGVSNAGTRYGLDRTFKTT